MTKLSDGILKKIKLEVLEKNKQSALKVKEHHKS